MLCFCGILHQSYIPFSAGHSTLLNMGKRGKPAFCLFGGLNLDHPFIPCLSQSCWETLLYPRALVGRPGIYFNYAHFPCGSLRLLCPLRCQSLKLSAGPIPTFYHLGWMGLTQVSSRLSAPV